MNLNRITESYWNKQAASSIKLLFSFSAVFILFSSSIFSEKIYKIADWDVSDYPQVRVDLKVRETLSGKEDEIQITEDIASAKKVSTSFELTTHSEPNPVHFYLSIPSYANWEEKRWLVQFAQSIASVAEKSKGKFFLNVQSDDQFLFYEGVPSSKLTPAFSLPKEKEPKYPIRSWEKVLSRVHSDTNPDKVMIVVSLKEEWEDRYKISDFARRVNAENIDFLVVAPPSLETTKLASYVNGRFFNITKKESFAELYSEINHLISPKLRLVYLSPWNVSLWQQSIIVSNLALGEGNSLSFSYEISPLHSLYRKGKDPLVFYPVLLFLIIVCLSVLYFLRGYSAPLENKSSLSKQESSPTKILPPRSGFYEERNKEEVEVYERVYGEVAERARENEIIAQIVERDKITGENYSYGVLILKEGAGSGTQFPVRGEEITLGRGEANHIVLSDPYAELLHAKIKKVRGRFLIFDCASSTGVFLNGKKLLRPKALYDLDEIEIGKTLFSFRAR
ncbi:FHA domain-containing protein [Leptospira idonii]|uniref:FHA domain-containing protein n=1 Tax=Leptospira idonii TaxID=1193500 RepID=A0A4R9LW88_9LEPT|nr:FHA domain-containing protein [Leptospira idonii]TGN18490.1 FHA domain-containing protein [Leptospira idonii]